MQGGSRGELKQTKYVKKKKKKSPLLLQSWRNSKAQMIAQLVQENSAATFLCCLHRRHVLPLFPLSAVRKMTKKERPWCCISHDRTTTTHFSFHLRCLLPSVFTNISHRSFLILYWREKTEGVHSDLLQFFSTHPKCWTEAFFKGAFGTIFLLFFNVESSIRMDNYFCKRRHSLVLKSVNSVCTLVSWFCFLWEWDRMFSIEDAG